MNRTIFVAEIYCTRRVKGSRGFDIHVDDCRKEMIHRVKLPMRSPVTMFSFRYLVGGPTPWFLLACTGLPQGQTMSNRCRDMQHP